MFKKVSYLDFERKFCNYCCGTVCEDRNEIFFGYVTKGKVYPKKLTKIVFYTPDSFLSFKKTNNFSNTLDRVLQVNEELGSPFWIKCESVKAKGNEIKAIDGIISVELKEKYKNDLETLSGLYKIKGII